ncbi:MAG TPA: glycerol-3-phosphate 1-O-acyltransferase PlsY [Tepidisphaeraceae bacterium]|jgi:glycerol-3-phosphate acyltransferase PlsY
MSLTAQLLTLAAVAYFVGSIPFGLLVGRAKGIDPRTSGSGNIGATNLGRLLGGKYFALVFALDLLKGLLPMLAAAYLVRDLLTHEKPYLLWMAVGAAAVLGHLFPVYLKFQGGKGVATSGGVVLGLWPFLTLPGFGVIGVFLLVFAVTRTVSLGSLAASASFPFLFILIGWTLEWPVFGEQLPLLIFGTFLASLIIYRHRANIVRLLNGTEGSFKKSVGS